MEAHPDQACIGLFAPAQRRLRLSNIDQLNVLRSFTNGWKWPGRAKSEFELAAVKQSFEAGHQDKF
jgi:hypothetical protein